MAGEDGVPEFDPALIKLFLSQKQIDLITQAAAKHLATQVEPLTSALAAGVAYKVDQVMPALTAYTAAQARKSEALASLVKSAEAYQAQFIEKMAPIAEDVARRWVDQVGVAKLLAAYEPRIYPAPPASRPTTERPVPAPGPAKSDTRAERVQRAGCYLAYVVGLHELAKFYGLSKALAFGLTVTTLLIVALYIESNEQS